MNCVACGKDFGLADWCSKCGFRPCETCGKATGAMLVRECLKCAYETEAWNKALGG